MKNSLPLILFALVLIGPSWAFSQAKEPLDVQSAQQKVWDIQLQLNNARYRLAVLKLDLQKANLSEALLKARQKGDQAKIAKIQQLLENIDHAKQTEQQRLDLMGQILIAEQQANKPLQDSLRLELRNLK